jgi:hypothetical protein
MDIKETPAKKHRQRIRGKKNPGDEPGFERCIAKAKIVGTACR